MISSRHRRLLAAYFQGLGASLGVSLACVSCTGAGAAASVGAADASRLDGAGSPSLLDGGGSPSLLDGAGDAADAPHTPDTPNFPAGDGGTHDAARTGAVVYMPCATDADVSVDAAGAAASDAAPDASACRSLADWPDPGCPPDPSAFAESCASPGMHCQEVNNVAPGGPAVTRPLLCTPAGDDSGASSWTMMAPLSYTDCLFGQLPNDIPLDDSDCATRPVTACSCPQGAPRESAIGGAVAMCARNNPDVYVAFDDAGCAKDVRYDNARTPSSDFVSCVRAALAAARWDCVGPATHVVVQGEMYVGPYL